MNVPVIKEIVVPKGCKEYGIVQGIMAIEFFVGELEAMKEGNWILIPLAKICAITLEKRGKSLKWATRILVGAEGGFGEIWIEAANRETANSIWRLFEDTYEKATEHLAIRLQKVAAQAAREVA